MATVTATRSAEERFEQICTLRKKTMPASDSARLRASFDRMKDLYASVPHSAGGTVLEHCIGVLEEYQRFEPDDDGVVACLLHHAMDEGHWTPEDIEKASNASVRSIVMGIHLLSHVTMQNRRMSLQNMRMMFLRVSDDMRAVLLILCDRHHLLKYIDKFPLQQRKHISRDTLQLFAPAAARLGIYSLKHEMESRAFPIAYPTDAARIAEQLQEMKALHGSFLHDAAINVQRALLDQGVATRVEAREKQSYSIFRKMRTKSLSHAGDLYDLFALRVIVHSEPACYQALGVLHQIGHPVANRFKDFVAFPKPNGYRSLHTTLMRLPGVPEGVFLEVQIRTDEMHRQADLGLAAHWSYKEGGKAIHAMHRTQLQQALTSNPTAVDHIFALTPAGDVIELPEGATPLDFAFHVHTTLGLSFRAARVNGAIVPIAHELENGDIVEILRHSEPKPSPQWVSIVHTASARTRLRHFLAEHDRPATIQLGREAMNRALQKHDLPSLDPNLTLLRTIAGKHLTLSDREDLLFTIGKGSKTALATLREIEELALYLDQSVPNKQLATVHPTEKRSVKIEGGIPMPLRFALCCKPDIAPFVPLSGVIGRDGSIRVHRATCKMLRNANPERQVAVGWEVEEKTGQGRMRRKRG